METRGIESTWSDRVVEALTVALDRDFRQGEDQTRVERVRVVTPDALEVVYAFRGQPRLRGIRFTRTQAQRGPELFRDRTPEELGWYLAHTGVLEPHDDSLFQHPDQEGVSWIRTEAWMSDVAGE